MADNEEKIIVIAKSEIFASRSYQKLSTPIYLTTSDALLRIAKGLCGNSTELGNCSECGLRYDKKECENSLLSSELAMQEAKAALDALLGREI